MIKRIIGSVIFLFFIYALAFSIDYSKDRLAVMSKLEADIGKKQSEEFITELDKMSKDRNGSDDVCRFLSQLRERVGKAIDISGYLEVAMYYINNKESYSGTEREKNKEMFKAANKILESKNNKQDNNKMIKNQHKNNENNKLNGKNSKGGVSDNKMRWYKPNNSTINNKPTGGNK